MKKFISILLAVFTLLSFTGCNEESPSVSDVEVSTDQQETNTPDMFESEITETEPIQTEPTQTEQPQTEEIVTEPTQTEPAETEPAETEPPLIIKRDDFTIEVSDDTYVVNADGSGDRSNEIFVDQNVIDVKTFGASHTRYGYLKFDISELAYDSFTCVELDLTAFWRQYDPGNPEFARIEIYGCDTSWQGSSLSFNTQPEIFGLITALDDLTDKQEMRSYAVTSYVKKALESGFTEVAFMIKEATPELNLRIQFYAKESGEYIPKLSVYHDTKVDNLIYEGKVGNTAPEIVPDEKIVADLSIEVSDDTYVVNADGSGDHSNDTYSTEKVIDVKTVGDSHTRYGYLKFDISDLIDKDFTCIELDLTVFWRQYDPGNPEFARIEIYGCDANWQGSVLTFNTQPETFGLITALDDVSDKQEMRSYAVTSYIKKALEIGSTEVAFMIKEATPELNLRIQFYSKEGGENAPMLSVYNGTKTDDSIYEDSSENTEPENKLPEVSKNGLDAIIGFTQNESVAFDVVEDTYVRAGEHLKTNFGSEKSLIFKAMPGLENEIYRIVLLKFDVSELKNIDVVTADLSLNCIFMEEAAVPTRINVYKCFPYDWDETEVTYKTLPEREEFITSALVYSEGNVRIDITEYIKRAKSLGQNHVSFWLEGDADSVRMLHFSSKESGEKAPQILIGQSNVGVSTLIHYDGVNPWEYAMENVSDWMHRWEKIKQGGDNDAELILKDGAEYSLEVDATRHPDGANTAYTSYLTRNVKTLKGYTANPEAAAMCDVYGGLIDESLKQEATGFFYTKKIGDRWWTIDPLGYPFYRSAVVAVTTGSDRQTTMLVSKYGSVENWAISISDRLRELGFNSVGGWSNTAELMKNKQPLAQTGILYTVNQYAGENGLFTSNSGSTDLLYGIIPVFDPEFVSSVNQTVKSTTSGYLNSPYIYGWMSDNELPANLGMLENSLVLDTSDPRFIYSYATAWTFMYMKTGKTEVTVADVTDELRREYRAMVYDRYFKVVCEALERYEPVHQYMGCRFLEGCYTDEYVMRVAGYWCDVISINYYGAWEGDPELLANMQKWAGKPFIVTEWYAKGMDVWENDNRITNISGAGWTVRTQADRGRFYQNYALQLLECKGCVGFDWFQYLDNDPNNLGADLSNRNANKGIIDNNGDEYIDLTKYMGELNNQKYSLINFFDERNAAN